jgi:hypothetical protein
MYNEVVKRVLFDIKSSSNCPQFKHIEFESALKKYFKKKTRKENERRHTHTQL